MFRKEWLRCESKWWERLLAKTLGERINCGEVIAYYWRGKIMVMEDITE